MMDEVTPQPEEEQTGGNEEAMPTPEAPMAPEEPQAPAEDGEETTPEQPGIM